MARPIGPYLKKDHRLEIRIGFPFLPDCQNGPIPDRAYWAEIVEADLKADVHLDEQVRLAEELEE